MMILTGYWMSYLTSEFPICRCHSVSGLNNYYAHKISRFTFRKARKFEREGRLLALASKSVSSYCPFRFRILIPKPRCSVSSAQRLLLPPKTNQELLPGHVGSQ